MVLQEKTKILLIGLSITLHDFGEGHRQSSRLSMQKCQNLKNYLCFTTWF